MATHEAISFSQPAAGSSAAQVLTQGGEYVIDVLATGTGTVTLQKLGPDGTTWITAATAVTATSSSAPAILSPGQYRITTATFTAVLVTVARAPLN